MKARNTTLTSSIKGTKQCVRCMQTGNRLEGRISQKPPQNEQKRRGKNGLRASPGCDGSITKATRHALSSLFLHSTASTLIKQQQSIDTSGNALHDGLAVFLKL
eukprot:855681-Pelagomonas_calceolata.AAC.2